MGSLVVKKCAGKYVGAAEVATQMSASLAFFKTLVFPCKTKEKLKISEVVTFEVQKDFF